MPLTPMFHVHAWGIPFAATAAGLKQVYPGRYVPDTILKLLVAEKVTFSHCVPTIMHMLLSSPACTQVDLKGWKVIIGGSALPTAMAKAAVARGIDIFAGYGMSETCPILTLAHLTPEMLELSPEEQTVIRCKTGRSLPLVDLRVVDGQMREQPRDNASPGEIVVRAPWLTQGYLKDHKASERLWEGGFLHTGDVAVRDELGYVRITDRSKDIIKMAGEWVSSLELEDIIAHHPDVAEVAVIGVPDEKWGERALALVVTRPDSGLTEKDVIHHIKQYIDKGMVSKQVVLLKVRFVDAIDKTSVGKVSKVTLREKYAH
jgi:fatty-acyl-CoA synthase